MRMEMPKGAQYTPLLIGVCNEEAAALCADSRATFFDGDGFKQDDNCRKIFKVNDGLLFGACGLFDNSELLVDPLVGQDCESLDVDAAKELAEAFILGELAAWGQTHERCYVMAGLDADGRHCLAYVRYNAEDGQIETEKQVGDEQGSYLLLLPPNAQEDSARWRERLEETLADNGAPLSVRLSGYVAEVSAVSELIGGTVKCVSVR